MASVGPGLLVEWAIESHIRLEDLPDLIVGARVLRNGVVTIADDTHAFDVLDFHHHSAVAYFHLGSARRHGGVADGLSVVVHAAGAAGGGQGNGDGERERNDELHF